MMKKILLFLFLGLFAVSMHTVYSHEEEQDFNLEPTEIYPIKPLSVVGYGFLIFAVLIAVILLVHGRMNDTGKKIIYFLIVATVSFVTIYLMATTLHLNIISIAKGPVHWHADFELWVCGDEIKLAEPQGLSNKQGFDLMHAHEDNRIHVEGVILDKKAASLGAFFYAIGGSITDDGFRLPSNEGIVSVHNGDQCNSQESKFYVFVNGRIIDNPREYVISPYEKVPPGDRIKIIFTEKPIEEIDPYIKNEIHEGEENGS